MYDKLSQRFVAATSCPKAIALAVAFACIAATPLCASAEDFAFDSPVIKRIGGLSERLEITTNSSRILTLDKKIPRVQVNNPDLLSVTPLSATQIQVSAKKAGVTQVNLWDEDGQVYSVDVLIYGDVRELQHALMVQFPHSSIKVYRYSESLVLKGFVDRPDHVSQIVRLSEDYAPKVINNITVGGVQQILLKVKVMEVSRTKLRELGVDWAYLGGNGNFAVSRPSGIIDTFSSSAQSITSAGDTFSFGIVNHADDFIGVLQALQERNIAKILAEPNIVAVSGRPAQFNVGGETPVLIPQSLGTTSIEYKPFGTQVDFLPIVLGNGNIRLEVRPRVSSIDESVGIQLQDIRVPGFRVRQVDTAVEMKAGQTFALAGLVQQQSTSLNRGLPYISDIPFFGVPFRKMRDEIEEIELLIIVTPEFVDAMDPHEVPCGLPGLDTVSPNNHDLFCGGQVEVPVYDNPTAGMQACGDDDCGCAPNSGCAPSAGETIISDDSMMHGGMGYSEPTPEEMPAVPALPKFNESLMPENPAPPAGGDSQGPSDPSARPFGPYTPVRQAGKTGPWPNQTVPRTYSPQRAPVYMRNSPSPNEPYSRNGTASAEPDPAGLIGPFGYDVP